MVPIRINLEYFKLIRKFVKSLASNTFLLFLNVNALTHFNITPVLIQRKQFFQVKQYILCVADLASAYNWLFCVIDILLCNQMKTFSSDLIYSTFCIADSAVFVSVVVKFYVIDRYIREEIPQKS